MFFITEVNKVFMFFVEDFESSGHFPEQFLEDGVEELDFHPVKSM